MALAFSVDPSRYPLNPSTPLTGFADGDDVLCEGDVTAAPTGYPGDNVTYGVDFFTRNQDHLFAFFSCF